MMVFPLLLHAPLLLTLLRLESGNLTKTRDGCCAAPAMSGSEIVNIGVQITKQGARTAWTQHATIINNNNNTRRCWSPTLLLDGRQMVDIIPTIPTSYQPIIVSVVVSGGPEGPKSPHSFVAF